MAPDDSYVVIGPIRCKKCSYKGDIESFEKLHLFIPVIKCPQCDETDVDIIARRECCVKGIAPISTYMYAKELSP